MNEIDPQALFRFSVPGPLISQRRLPRKSQDLTPRPSQVADGAGCIACRLYSACVAPDSRDRFPTAFIRKCRDSLHPISGRRSSLLS